MRKLNADGVRCGRSETPEGTIFDPRPVDLLHLVMIHFPGSGVLHSP